MILLHAYLVPCNYCGEIIKVWDYEGLEGGRYSAHLCPELERWDYGMNIFDEDLLLEIDLGLITLDAETPI